MSNKLKYSLLGLLLTATVALGGDLLIKSRGNIIFEAGGSYVKVNKPLQVNAIKNLDGTAHAPGGMPIGGVVAVVPNLHANLWQLPASGVIKDGFMRADGNTVPSCSDCVIPAGTILPNMVGDYVKGGTTSGTVTLHATELLTTTTLPALSTSSIATGGQVDLAGNAVVHNHTADHSHVTNNTLTTHTHNYNHTHSPTISAVGAHAHYGYMDSTGTSHVHDGEGPTGHSLSKLSAGSASRTFAFTQANGNAPTYNGPWVGWYGGSHTHAYSSGNAAPFQHTHTQYFASTGAIGTGWVSRGHTHTVASYTGTPLSENNPHTHTFSSMTLGSGSTPITVELSYVQVVWVIRVK